MLDEFEFLSTDIVVFRATYFEVFGGRWKKRGGRERLAWGKERVAWEWDVMYPEGPLRTNYLDQFFPRKLV